MKEIVMIMDVPPRNRDLPWVKDALKAAIQLEFATISPYLYAAWSITGDDPGGCFTSIKDIAVEEMLHMGIACNILAAVGGQPDILGVVPKYPTRLPMDVHKGLEIGLASLSGSVLRNVFMRIEEPPKQVADDPDWKPSGKLLIGKFYDDLWDAIRALHKLDPLKLDEAGQVKMRLGNGEKYNFWIMNEVDDIKRAIDVIKIQGEGSTNEPFEDSDDPANPKATDRPAHFYQFGEIYRGRKLILEEGRYRYLGKEVPMPKVRDAKPALPLDPAAVKFDQEFTRMVQLLHKAWNSGDKKDGWSVDLKDSVAVMKQLGGLADALFEQRKGPRFRLTPGAGAEQPDQPAVEPVQPSVTGRYGQVLGILDAAVGQDPFGAHGPFWRGLTRDQFVDHTVFGRQLVTVGDGAGSNLVKALRGELPFGSDTGTTGATFRRMPAGRPPVADADIAVIATWIDDGCPADEVAAEGADDTEVSLSTGAFRPPKSVYVDYFREIRAWSLDSRADNTVGQVLAAYGAWTDRVRDPATDQAWVDAISVPEVTDALRQLSTVHRRSVETHFGVPVPLLTVLDAYERWGNGGLPEDPLTPGSPRPVMNNASLWFVYASFADACVRLGIAPDFWHFMMRAILCGLLNDGLFRDRFAVRGFTADTDGRLAVFGYVQTVSDADLPAELGRRYLDSGL